MRGIVTEVTRPVPQVEPVPPAPVEVWVPDPDYADLPDAEVAALAEKAGREHRRRSILAGSLVAADDAARAWHAASGHAEGDPWVEPAGPTSVYPLGWVAEHGERLWRSTMHANGYRPGDAGWEPVS